MLVLTTKPEVHSNITQMLIGLYKFCAGEHIYNVLNRTPNVVSCLSGVISFCLQNTQARNSLGNVGTNWLQNVFTLCINTAKHEGCISHHVLKTESPMAVWAKASQWHEIVCNDPEVMGSNLSRVELWGCIVHGLNIFYSSQDMIGQSKKLCLALSIVLLFESEKNIWLLTNKTHSCSVIILCLRVSKSDSKSVILRVP